MKKLTLKKGQIIQRKGDLNHQVYYVESGLLRSYCIDKNDRESIFMFAPEGWTIADSTNTGFPAELFIDALEDSEVVVLPKDLKREQQHIDKLVKRLSVMQNRIMMLLSSSAIERYTDFIEMYPDIAQRVPQKMIASYLGVTQETLSAAKSQWLKKNRKES